MKGGRRSSSSSSFPFKLMLSCRLIALFSHFHLIPRSPDPSPSMTTQLMRMLCESDKCLHWEFTVLDFSPGLPFFSSPSRCVFFCSPLLPIGRISPLPSIAYIGALHIV